MGVANSLGDYAMIGDCHTAALVGKDGSIDWLCLPRFDSPACFAAILGTKENGRWLLAPLGKVHATRAYRPGTLILETTFRTARGTVTIVDCMPQRKKHAQVIRIVRCKRGTVQMRMDLAIRFDYGLTVPWVTKKSRKSLLAIAGPDRLVFDSSVPVRGQGLSTVADFTLRRGETATFELTYGRSFKPLPPRSSPRQALKRTEAWWREWISHCTYRGQSREAVERSLIVLKALIFAPTGGMIAAPTTSLPEQHGGALNWDYRYCWLRDATFTTLGFIHAGFKKEAEAWRKWLMRSVAGSPDQIQVLYGPGGERLLREWEVPWLAGYRKARPVRVGNLASEQVQLDVYGELADVLYQARIAMKKDGEDFDVQCALIEHLTKVWREPDHGIWEVRGKRRHFTHSKVMTWVAFDRTIRSAESFRLKAPLDEWKTVRKQIHDDICRRGFDPRLNSFVQSYDSKQVDASLLILPMVGFLPPKDPRIVGTVKRIEKDLIRDGFVLRYATNKPGGHWRSREGVFLPCTFWLADYYELIGRRGRARQILQRVLKAQNDVGLLAEEYDPKRKELMGNFPQALSHVALVNTVINLHTKHGPARQRSGTKRKPSRFM
jgi:GH15 family glucan-1,4-alpha-glucosidase